jgi:hypothetical protein
LLTADKLLMVYVRQVLLLTVSLTFSLTC